MLVFIILQCTYKLMINMVLFNLLYACKRKGNRRNGERCLNGARRGINFLNSTVAAHRYPFISEEITVFVHFSIIPIHFCMALACLSHRFIKYLGKKSFDEKMTRQRRHTDVVTSLSRCYYETRK